MLFPASNIGTTTLSDELFEKKQVSVSVLRLDAIHPVVSGNKLFKLNYFLDTATRQSYDGIITFGGAYSNHLVAAAFACREAGLICTGIVRGEQPTTLSHTLLKCIEYGMSLKFISRQDYDKKEQPGFLRCINLDYKNNLVIPEGGFHPLGAAGAALIMDLIDDDTSHICCAVGTATTISGLMEGIGNSQQVIGVPVLKNMHDIEQRIEFLTNKKFGPQQLKVMDGYHFGGYAKKTPVLIEFMNQLYGQHQLPTDFVYTGKMMYGVIDSIRNGLFAAGSKIVCIHTGGLQGNLSLPKGSLIF